MMLLMMMTFDYDFRIIFLFKLFFVCLFLHSLFVLSHHHLLSRLDVLEEKE